MSKITKATSAYFCKECGVRIDRPGLCPSCAMARKEAAEAESAAAVGVDAEAMAKAAAKAVETALEKATEPKTETKRAAKASDAK